MLASLFNRKMINLLKLIESFIIFAWNPVGLLATTLLGTNFKAADQFSSSRQTDRLFIHVEKRA